MKQALTRYNREESIRLMNEFGAAGRPFVFLISFDGERNCLEERDEAARKGFFMEFPELVNHRMTSRDLEDVFLHPEPVSRDRYRAAFHYVRDQIHYGNSFLLNLTFPTRIQCNYGLRDIFTASRASFKLFLEDELVVFSPERFIRIDGQSIRSYPMKGTMDASIPGAHALLTSDEKEDAEHNTIVDLIRNDLSQVARDVRVRRFKYIDRVRTHSGELLQMSSEISGRLDHGFEKGLGEILFRLLPAGSICGAPKKKTLEVIRQAEQYKRGYYTGVFGYWDGKVLDTAVAIRYMEQDERGLVFKSGGGITFRSDWKKEYDEMLKKVYVPVY